MPFDDDPTIPDEERLLRRVPHDWWYHDENLGRRRPASMAFDDTEMSVDIASERMKAGQPETACLVGHEEYGLVSITARLAREHGQAVCRDPLPDNPAHGVVAGKKTSGRKKAFSLAAVTIVDPQNPR